MSKVDVYVTESRKAAYEGELNCYGRPMALNQYNVFKKLDGVGTFLGFGLQVVEGENGDYASESCTIVDMGDGTVRKVDLEHIKFHDKDYFNSNKLLPKQVTPNNQKHIPGLLITHNN